MEKRTLNNEIVLCRSSIRKARVRIIRKKIKKIKILKSAKKDGEKEKKSKKADRLVEEVMMLKKVREDDVTKFALQNQDLATILKNTPANDHEHVYATLALFPDVQKRVQHIRDNIPDWESSLPTLLQHLGTRSMLKKWKKINKGAPLPPNTLLKPSGEKIPEESVPLEKELELHQKKKKVAQRTKVERNSKGSERESDTDQVEVEDKEIVKNETNTVNCVVPEMKVDDPFFVAKKVSLPKLLLSEVLEDPNKELKFSRDEPEPNRWSRGKQFDKVKQIPRERVSRRFPAKGVEVETAKPVEEEKLHPSWAAKKVKLIQPFQGKKIKFDLD